MEVLSKKQALYETTEFNSNLKENTKIDSDAVESHATAFTFKFVILSVLQTKHEIHEVENSTLSENKKELKAIPDS